MKSYRSRRRGFTLIEVLMVLVILVIIASLAVGSYMAQQEKAKRLAAKSQVGLLESPLDLYQLDIGMYPTTNQGLLALVNPPADLPNPGAWDGPYMKTEIPMDPWGRPYNYMCPGRYNPNSYDLWSSGPNMIDGDADDIGNWSTGVR
jgi:general secretion pathway protein G